MKKTIITALMLVASSLFGNDVKVKSQIENLPMMKSIGVKVQKVLAHDGVYQFKGIVSGKKGGKIEGFVTKDFKTLMMGKAYSMATGNELVIPFEIDVKTLKSIAAYKIGNGKEEYFVFTDPECPYCQRLENSIHSVNPNATLYTILFPLNFHKNAKSMCRYILSRKDNRTKAKAMKEIASKSNAYKQAKYSEVEREALNKMIEKSLTISNKIGINSTPTILNSKGMRVSPQAIIR